MASTTYEHTPVRIVVERGTGQKMAGDDAADHQDLSLVFIGRVEGRFGYEAQGATVDEAAGRVVQHAYPLSHSRRVRNFRRPTSPALLAGLTEQQYVLLQERNFTQVGAAARANQIPGVEVEVRTYGALHSRIGEE